MSGALEPLDLQVRGLLTRKIAELGYAPPLTSLSDDLHLDTAEVEASLLRLHAAHALLLHPDTTRPWVVHPFALSPGSCWVQSAERGWWSNCLYCAFGVAAATRGDADITTRLGGESETVVFEIRDGRPAQTEFIFHMSTPVRRWWDNVIHACASFQPFRSDADVDDWCARHDLPKGALLTIEQLWSFASDWYGAYLDTPWRRRDSAEAQALFTRHGLTGDFWSVV